MKKFIIFIIILLALALILSLVFDWGRKRNIIPVTGQESTTTSDMPTIFSPLDNQTVTSPIYISGKIPGNWFFEGSFPVQLLNSNGDIIATTTARTPEDWATTSIIDFYATLVYPKATTTDHGLIILKNDNPSGLPQFDKEKIIQVILK